MGTKAVQKSVCCLVFRFQSKLINNGWGLLYLLATRIPVIQCQVPLLVPVYAGRGTGLINTYILVTGKERGEGAGAEKTDLTIGVGSLRAILNVFQSELARKWEVIDSGTVEAFFLFETFSFADGWLHKPAWLCSRFPSQDTCFPQF